jgi:hypothetical protein
MHVPGLEGKEPRVNKVNIKEFLGPNEFHRSELFCFEKLKLSIHQIIQIRAMLGILVSNPILETDACKIHA